MNNNAFDIDDGVEFESSYSEIEFLLSKFDGGSDPIEHFDDAPVVSWEFVAEHASLLLEKCFDLRVALWIMRAGFRLNGVSAFYLGIASIDAQYLSGGEGLFPKSVNSDPPDSIHSAALGWLASSIFLQELKNCRLFPGTQLSLADLLNFRQSEQEGGDLHYSDVIKVIGHADTFFAGRGIPCLQKQLSMGMATLERIEYYSNLRAIDYRLDCHLAKDYLLVVSRFMSVLEQHGQTALINEVPEVPSMSEVEGCREVIEIVGGRVISSRQGAILMLDQVLDYFQQHEPSHPAPILIRRSQKMIGMDFTTIVEELLPESIIALQNLSGR